MRGQQGWRVATYWSLIFGRAGGVVLGVWDDRLVLVKIEAKPEPIAIRPRETAVVAVDMQNDFGAAGGMFASKRLPIEAARATIAPTARVLEGARKAGMTVVYLKMEFARDLSNLGCPGAPTARGTSALASGVATS